MDLDLSRELKGFKKFRKVQKRLNEEFNTQIRICVIDLSKSIPGSGIQYLLSAEEYNSDKPRKEYLQSRMTKYGVNLTEQMGFFIPDTWLIMYDLNTYPDIYKDKCSPYKIKHLFCSQRYARGSYHGRPLKPKKYFYSSGLNSPNGFKELEDENTKKKRKIRIKRKKINKKD